MEPHSHQNGSAQTGPVVANNEEGEQRPLWAGAERFTKIKKPFLWKEVAKEYFLSFVPHSVFWYVSKTRRCATCSLSVLAAFFNKGVLH
jgi:hypothetical protein